MSSRLPVGAVPSGAPEQRSLTIASARQSNRSILTTIVAGAVAPAFAMRLDTLSIVTANDRLLRLLGRESEVLDGRPCTALCAGPDGVCLEPSHCPIAELFESDGAEAARVMLLDAGDRRLPLTVTGVLTRGGVAFISSEGAHETDVESPLVRVRTLGGFSMVSATGAELTPRRARTTALFKLLLTKQGAPLTESEARQVFWPDASRERAQNGLQVLIHDLRHMLEPGLTDGRRSRFIVRQSDSYVLAPDAPIEIDMQIFLRCAAAAHVEAADGDVERAERHARAALQAYTGDLFESDTEMAWFAGQRRRLRDTRIDVMLLLTKLLAGAGDRHAALEQCRVAAAADILREDAHRLLIVLLARDSGRVVASQYFVEMFAAFKARSGLPPSRETADLVDRIMKADELDEVERELLSPMGGYGEPASRTAS